jgi:tripartite-type tricarboxylate transporter receptor subunit TctC
MKNIRRQVVISAALLAAAQMSGSALAQAYPSKPITIVVAYPAGGDTDAMARLYAEKGPATGPARGGGQPARCQRHHRHRACGQGRARRLHLLLAPNTFAIAQFVLKTNAGSSYDVLGGFTPIVQTSVQPMFVAASQIRASRISRPWRARASATA